MNNKVSVKTEVCGFVELHDIVTCNYYITTIQ